MSDNSTIQSLDRGMQILELLSEHGRMTASAVGKELGIHQSSASRLLNSLVKAGLVYKPEFHCFALDFGVLLFAGKTMQGIPLVAHSTAVCIKIHKNYGLSAAVGTLFRDRVVYLARIADAAPFDLVETKAFPTYMSSIGRMLSYEQGKKKAIEIFQENINRLKEDESAEKIYDIIDQSVKKHGFLYMKDQYFNKVNASRCFSFQDKEACLAVYSETDYESPEKINIILNEAIGEIKNEEQK